MKYDLYARGDLSLNPGEARCPGPTVQDVIVRDSDNAPASLRAQAYEYLGSDDLAFSRYTDPRQHEREVERLWGRTWQWAARAEHIPNPGDYTVYDVDRYSVLLVRQGDGKVKAFANSCPHRGMALCAPGSSGRGKQFLRCPFHGMSWQLDGALRDIPCRWDFPHIEDDEFGLAEMACAEWGGFLFVNLDPECEPLLDYLEVLPEHFACAPLEARYVSAHTQKILPGNWKMVMEAFLEAYHVLATHPEGLRTSAWANTQYDVFGRHVSRFLQPLSSGNPHFGEALSEQDILQSLGRTETVAEGSTARSVLAAALREELGAEMDADLSEVCNSLMLDSIEYFLFPNACFFPGINIPLIYRFRPLGYDRCVHDIMLLTPVPDHGERPPPAKVVHLDIDDSYTTVPELGRLGHVLDQDTENFKRQWAGMRAARKNGQTLGNYQEVRIRAFHNTLDEYCDG